LKGKPEQRARHQRDIGADDLDRIDFIRGVARLAEIYRRAARKRKSGD
jgi:hypothetical protein